MKDAFIALGMGGPDSQESIEPFLYNLFSDRDIIDFKVGDRLQNFIAKKISKSRAKAISSSYEIMGGGSPQLMHTVNLCRKISQDYLEKTGRVLDTYTGMCYWKPYIEDTLKLIPYEQYNSIYFFPMYPQYSTTTTGVCFNRVNKFFLQTPIECKVIKYYYYSNDPAFIELLTNHIKKEAVKQGIDFKTTHMLFSAHSLPQYVIDKGDPYKKQIEEHVKMIMENLPFVSHSIAYQSKVGRIKWLEPSLKEELIKIKESGKVNIISYAVSFLNDHIETLVELDIETVDLAREMGLEFKRIPSFNDSDNFSKYVVEYITR